MKFRVVSFLVVAALPANGFSRCINPMPEAKDDDEPSPGRARDREINEHAKADKGTASRRGKAAESRPDRQSV